MVKRQLIIFILCATLAMVSGVAFAQAQNDSYQTMTVAAKTLVTPLYFTGTIKPLTTTNIVSPDDGVIVDMNFKYGQTVKKGDVLVKINSKKLEQDYDSALTNYLKAKDDFNLAVSKYKSTLALWKLKIISRDELTAAKSARDSAHIAYLQASYTLEDTIRRGPSISQDIKSLRLSDFEKVDKALKTRYNYVDVEATATGVALQPPRVSTSSGDESGNINVGSSVKLGQVITSIGDLKGLSVDINVNEIDINKVKLEQTVYITGVAFPEIKLKGYVSAIDAQASSQAGAAGGLPTFPVTVVVPELTPEQAKVIRVGMSAKVELDISEAQDIVVPIKAVYKKNNKSYVNILVDGKPVAREVSTGQTTLTSVEIKDGLNIGDKVITNDTSSN